MPVIKSAIKKLRQDKKRQKRNSVIKETLKSLLKKVRKNPTDKLLQEVFSAADKASRAHIIHKNKAARIKSSIAKLSVGTKSTEVKKPKKSSAKTPSKKT